MSSMFGEPAPSGSGNPSGVATAAPSGTVTPGQSPEYNGDAPAPAPKPPVTPEPATTTPDPVQPPESRENAPSTEEPEEDTTAPIDAESYSGDSGMDWSQVAHLVQFSLAYVKLSEGHREILRTLAAPPPPRRGRRTVKLPEDEPVAVAQALMGGNILVGGYWFIGEVMGALRGGADPTFDQGMRWVVTVQDSAPEFLASMFTYLNAVSKQFPTGNPAAEAYKPSMAPTDVVNQIRIAAASINEEGHDIIETMQGILATWPGSLYS